MNFKKHILHILVPIFSIITCIICLSIAVFSEVKAAFTIDESTYYTITYDGHKFRCYKLEDSEDEDAKKVAIAWFWSDDPEHPNTIPASLEVPDEVTIENDTYTVSSVLRAGFRGCTFTSIELPQTIEEINEEAFAYCMNMTSFTIPHKVTKIAPSTFMDCKALEVFYYTALKNSNDPDSEIIKSLGNNKITEIGDHAFDNCISLKGLYFPSTLVKVGQSAFQRCEKIQSLFFPTEYADHSNKITLEDYAFADCPILKTVYFEPNMYYIGAYCFANDKEDLTFTYTGSSEPTGFDAHWRDKRITTGNSDVYPFLPWGQQPIQFDDTYPGLIYAVENQERYLDCAGPLSERTDINSTEKAKTIKAIEGNSNYIVIRGFQEPFTTQPGYYDVDSKTLTIPNEIDGIPVKCIGQNAFAGKPLKSVIFNENLVQIQNRSFYGCNDIRSLNFDACTNLKEISYEVFQSPCPELFSTAVPTTYTNSQVYNDQLTTIALPNCLEFIGDSAFYNFINLTGGITFKGTDPDGASNLKLIGDFAFSVHRTKNYPHEASELIDIELPNSLDDRYAKGITINGAEKKANYYHPYNPYDGNKRVSRYAVGRFVFENQDIIGTVCMEEATSAQANNLDYTTSFMSNAFVRCNNIHKFKTNKNFYLFGSDSFKLCPSLKEVFFYSDKAQLLYLDQTIKGSNYPWGLRDNAPTRANDLKNSSYFENGIFVISNDSKDLGDWGNRNSHPDTIIYVSGATAPGQLDDFTKYRNGLYKWNSNPTDTFNTELGLNSGAGQFSYRKEIPTYYQAVWEGASTNVYYWKPGANGGTFRTINPADSEYTLSRAEYATGYTAIFKNPTTNKYTITRYYSDGTTGNYSDKLDYSNVVLNNTNIAGDITKVGACSFAIAADIDYPVYFVLPDSITEIGERAFFRKGRSANGVRIVTYKTGNNIQVPTGSQAYDNCITNYSSSVGGFCILPSGVTRIEANSFYNNQFKTIKLGSNLAYFGASAFATKAYNNLSRELDFTPQQGSEFYFDNTTKGLYYQSSGDKKTLVYQIGGGSTDTLTFSSGTKAVGFRAAVHTNYETITFPNGLTTIYGGAFMNSAVKTVNGDLSTIKYISARTLPVTDGSSTYDSEVYDAYDGTYPFDNYDVTYVAGKSDGDSTYVDGARGGAFKGCTSLKTFDFTKLTSVKAIGQQAFSGCTNLVEATDPNTTYTIYSYVGKSRTQAASQITLNSNTAVLDLSQCTNLRKVGSNAFGNITKLKYVITPNTTGTSTTLESLITFESGDHTLCKDSYHLIGETYHQAGVTYGHLNARTHYPLNVLHSAESWNYYRFFIDASLDIDDYLARDGDNNINESCQYWTIYGGAYYLFKGYTQASKFFTLVTTNPSSYTAGAAIDWDA